MPVTQSDIDRAAELVGLCSEAMLCQAFAAHRETAFLEGVKAGLEAAAKEAGQYTASRAVPHYEFKNGVLEARAHISRRIRAIEPGSIEV